MRALGRLAVPVAVAGALAACQQGAARTRVVVSYSSGALNLVSHRTNDEISNAILRHAYEPLVDFGPDLSLVPCLARSWHNPDELTWAFRLRHGVQRHDGRALTAADVAGYFNGAAADPEALRGARDIARVEAVGEDVVFHTRRPIGWLPSLIARQLVSLEPPAPGEPPVGTGPWRFTTWEADGDAVLEAFDRHWSGAPGVERIEFRVLPPAEAVAALRRHEVHLMLDVPVPEWEALRQVPGIGTHAQPGLRVYYLMFNLLGPPGRPLRDIRVRQAIALALDRDSLLSGPLAGAGEPIRSLMPPAVFGHHPGGLAPQRDVEAARRLLREAGRARGLTLSLALGRQADSPALGRALERTLAEVGIGLELVEEFPTLSTPEAAAAGPDMYLLGWLHSSGDAGASYEYLAHSPGPGAAGSVSGYSDPDLDRSIAEASGPLAMRDRRDRLIAIAEVLQSRVVMIPLYRQVDRYAWVRPLQIRPRLDRRIRVDELRWGTPLPRSARWP